MTRDIVERYDECAEALRHIAGTLGREGDADSKRCILELEKEMTRRFERLRARCKALEEAHNGLHMLVAAAQSVLAAHLLPDGNPLNIDELALGALISLFDGPEQREIQSRIPATVEAICPKGPCSGYGRKDHPCEWPHCALTVYRRTLKAEKTDG